MPMLRAKAGVPAADVRSNIGSHRARSTIASRLNNAHEPMPLFECRPGSDTATSTPLSTRPLSPRLLAAKENLLHMLAAIPLSNDERAAAPAHCSTARPVCFAEVVNYG
ncbi:hypothetical protein GCM10009735_70250 [Actinomadura chokoriensis]